MRNHFSLNDMATKFIIPIKHSEIIRVSHLPKDFAGTTIWMLTLELKGLFKSMSMTRRIRSTDIGVHSRSDSIKSEIKHLLTKDRMINATLPLRRLMRPKRERMHIPTRCIRVVHLGS